MNGLKELKLNYKFKNFRVSEPSIAFFLSMQFFLNPDHKIVYFASDNSKLETIEQSLKSLNFGSKVSTFPSFDCNFFSNLSPTASNKSARIKTLYNLINNEKMILICSLESLVEKTVSKNELINKELILNKESNVSYNQIIEYLINNRYERVEFLNNVGEFAKRGEIIDIFSPSCNFPIRIFFNFEKIENLQEISIKSQETTNSVDFYKLIPASEIFFDDHNISFFREQFREIIVSNKEDYYNSISKKKIIEGSEQFFPILNRSFSSLLEYLHGFKLFFHNDFEEQFKNFFESKADEYGANKQFFVNKSDYLLNFQNFNKYLDQHEIYKISELDLYSRKANSFSEETIIPKEKNKILKILNNKSDIIILCYDSKVNELKFKKITNGLSRISKKISNIFEESLTSNFIYNLNIDIDISFTVFLKNQKIIFVSDKDVFNKITKTSTTSNIDSPLVIKDFSQLEIGDLVVHIDHGIGKYNGLKSTKINNIDHEFIEILYHSNDKLFIPIQNLELISKYGDSDSKVALDKLGLSNWQKRKAIIKNKIKDIAKDLINIAAKRKLEKGEIVESATFEYERFSSQFEFTETSDQLKTINQIKADLSSGKPMDRLVCGDVGFGKTEIAMRAAFICISAGFQVVMICPKVLLVNQHYETFIKRFKEFDYKISKMSRFENAKEKRKVKLDLENGQLNLLISTHAIFAKDVSFYNLGLIIIDEEQSFGVEQKEKLKKFKPNCHILTLTATPIPRTLQSSIFKIKDISLIQTPPVNRVNIKTFLMIEDLNQIKRVIEKEIQRGGQIFYVSPRISDLENIKKKILSTSLNIRLATIHGTLNSTEIEKAYKIFSEKKVDILLSTAMIESGLDLSNVNTIIIEKPHLFGLAQLYQLRGRVGRSSTQAYAYFIIKNIHSLNEEALKKVKIITKIDKLGAGLSIASSDLSLRGAGNIIGAEQSGHIKEVGIELYYKMVQESINEIQNVVSASEKWSPQISLGFSINIGDEFIEDSNQRLALYREISEIDNVEKLRTISESLKNKYGNLPLNFLNLLFLIEIKIMAKELLIKKIDDTNTGFVLEFKDGAKMNVEKVLKYAKLNPNLLELKPKSKIILKSSSDRKKKIFELKSFLKHIKENFIQQ